MLQSGKMCEGIGVIGKHLIIPNLVEGGTTGHPEYEFRMDPFKNIYTAHACLYSSAIIYNWRKERQINCMYKTCLERNAETGLPIEICDDQSQQRLCMYVEGGKEWLERDGVGKTFLTHLLKWFLGNLDWFVESLVYELVKCPGKYHDAFIKGGGLPGGSSTEGGVGGEGTGTEVGGDTGFETCGNIEAYNDNAFFILCTSMLAGLVLQETGFFDSHDKKWEFKGELEGPDYCVTSGSGDS